MKQVLKGEIYLIDLGTNIGSEVNKIRPALIIQNNVGNKFSPTTIIAPISHRGNRNKKLLPTQIEIGRDMYISSDGNTIDGMVLLEQIRTIDKTRIVSECIGRLTPSTMTLIKKGIIASLDI